MIRFKNNRKIFTYCDSASNFLHDMAQDYMLASAVARYVVRSGYLPVWLKVGYPYHI